MQINLSDIVIPSDRLRKVDDRTVKGLAEDFRNPAVGQINPITLWHRKDGKWELIAGEHRYKAAELAGWSAIRAEHWQWQRDNPQATDEEVGLRARFIEAYENMKRKDLSAADLTYTDGRLIEAKDALRRLLDAQAREAKRAHIEAAIRTAKTEAEKKTAQSEKRKLDDADRKRNGYAEENAHHAQVPPQTTKGVLDEVAAESGRSPHSLRRSIERRNAVGSLEIVAEFRGTSLATTDEMMAYGDLRKLVPEKAEELRKKALEDYEVSAVKELAKVKAAQREEAEQAKLEKAKSDKFEASEIVSPKLQTGIGQLKDVLATAKKVGLASDLPEIERCLGLLEDARKRLSQFQQQTRQAKRTGVEGHKYPLVDPADTKQRDQARKDQDKNAKKSVKAVKKGR